MGVVIACLLLCTNRVAPPGGEEGLDLQALALARNFTVERNDFYTPSGYSLNVFRLRCDASAGCARIEDANDAPPQTVLLLHGLAGDMNMYIGNYDEYVLPFYLARRGFDVFAANFRGTAYTRAHAHNVSDAEFWNFSFHEIAFEDVPAIFAHVAQVAGHNRISTISLSMGCSVLLLSLGARQREVVDNVDKIIMISPILYLRNRDNVLLRALNDTNIVHFMAKYAGWRTYSDSSLWYLAAYTPQLFRYLLHFTFEDLASPLNAERFHYMVYFYPSGTSFRVFDHGLQLMQTGELKAYDYGSPHENAKRYDGATRPPSYSLHGVSEPIVMFFGKHDPIINDEEIAWMKRAMPYAQDIDIRFRAHGHMSFLHSNDTAFYEEIVRELRGGGN